MSEPVPLSDDVIEQLAHHIEQGLTMEQACGLVGASYESARSITSPSRLRDASEETRESSLRWGRRIARARAQCVADLLAELRQTTANARVKAIHHILMAVDPRFRDRGPGDGGVQVQVLIGGADVCTPGTLCESVTVDEGGQKALSEGAVET